jgi:hypothetical protein
MDVPAVNGKGRMRKGIRKKIRKKIGRKIAVLPIWKKPAVPVRGAAAVGLLLLLFSCSLFTVPDPSLSNPDGSAGYTLRPYREVSIDDIKSINTDEYLPYSIYHESGSLDEDSELIKQAITTLSKAQFHINSYYKYWDEYRTAENGNFVVYKVAPDGPSDTFTAVRNDAESVSECFNYSIAAYDLFLRSSEKLTYKQFYSFDTVSNPQPLTNISSFFAEVKNCAERNSTALVSIYESLSIYAGGADGELYVDADLHASSGSLVFSPQDVSRQAPGKLVVQLAVTPITGVDIKSFRTAMIIYKVLPWNTFSTMLWGNSDEDNIQLKALLYDKNQLIDNVSLRGRKAFSIITKIF